MWSICYHLTVNATFCDYVYDCLLMSVFKLILSFFRGAFIGFGLIVLIAFVSWLYLVSQNYGDYELAGFLKFDSKSYSLLFNINFVLLLPAFGLINTLKNLRKC